MKIDVTNYNVEQIEYRNSINDEKIVLVPREEIYYNPRNHRCICELEQLAFQRGITINEINEDIVRYQPLIKESLRASYNRNELERLKKEIKKKGQTKPLILSLGNIIQNGNTRFDLINQCIEENSEKYKKFEFLRCIYLPEDFDENEQEEFEISCQIENEIMVDYNWYDIARWMNDYIIYKGYSEEQVCKKFKMKDITEVRRYVDAYNEGIEYLQYLGKTNQVNSIKNDMTALFTIAKCRNTINYAYKEQLALKLSYAYLSSSKEEKGERLYIRLKKIFKYIDDIAETMLEHKAISNEMKSDNSNKDEMNILDIVEKRNDEESNIYIKLLNTFEHLVESDRSEFINLTNDVLDLQDLSRLNEKSSLVPEEKLKKALDYIVNAYVTTDKKIHNIKNILFYLNDIKQEINKYEEKIRK